MARVDVLMPQMGESIAEGTLSKWLKKLGDEVKRDEPLFEISNSGSSRFTSSPSFLSHLLKVPSAIDSPIWGINTSTRAIGSPQYAASHLAALTMSSVCGNTKSSNVGAYGS